MLRYLGERKTADRVEKALERVLKENKKLTLDLGGSAGTTEYTQAVIDAIC